MKTILRAVLLILLSLWLSSELLAQGSVPKVTFNYATIFDQRCSGLVQKPISPESLDELNRFVISLHSRWATDGPKLLGSIVKIVGKHFQFREANFALTLCEGFGSMSFPPILEMRPFLKSTAKGEPESAAVFETVIVHEVLHHYIDDCLYKLPNGTTPLLDKYKAESSVVRFHLHLFAIEKLLYSRLHLESYLAESIVSENKLKPAADFARARSIVDLETPQKLVRELSRFSK